MYAVSLSIGRAPWPWWMQIPIQSTGMLALATGIVLVIRRSRIDRIGVLLILFGLTWYVGDLQFSTEPALYAVGFCFFHLNAAVMAHVVLAFPSGRLRDGASRAIVAALYGVILITQPLRYALEDNPQPQVWGDPQADYSVWASIATISGLPLCVAVLVLLVRRWRLARLSMRRIGTPVWAAAVLATVLVLLFLINAVLHTPVQSSVVLFFGYAVILLTVPFASIVGTVREWFARAAAFDRLVDLEQAAEGRHLDLLARWLGDPSIEIYYWIPADERYVDFAGHAVTLLDDSSRLTVLDWGGRRLGALVHDAALAGAPQMLAVAATIKLVLENDRLQAELRARMHQLETASRMLLDTETAQRRELQEELHEGGQNHVIGALMVLTDLRRWLGAGQSDSHVTDLLEEADTRLRAIQRQMKEMSFNLYPPALEDGLQAGVGALLDRLGLPVRVGIPDIRWPGLVEFTAFRIISEALRNVITHAHARSATVHVTERDGRLIIQVSDDGIGGADEVQSSGLGLQRVRQLVTVWAASSSSTAQSVPGRA